MAKDIGSMAVKLIGDSKPLVNELDKTKKQVKQWGIQVGGVFRSLASGGGFGGIFAVVPGPMGAALAASHTLGLHIKTAAQELDKLAKESDRLGIATESLQTLQHAANLAGLDAAELATSLDRLNRMVGTAAASPLNEARNAFADLGLEANRLANQGLERTLEDIAEALSRVQSRSERARISFEIFGRQSARLDALLRGGASGIREARSQLERMGVLASRDELRRVEEMNDAFATLGRGLRGSLERFAIEIAPAVTQAVVNITSVVHLLTDALSEMGRNTGSVLNVINQAVASVSGTSADNSTRDLFQTASRSYSFFERRIGSQLGLPEFANVAGNAITAPFLPFTALFEQATQQLYPAEQRVTVGTATGLRPGVQPIPISEQIALARRALTSAQTLIQATSRGPDALVQGSAEAISTVIRHRIRAGQIDPVAAAIEEGRRIQDRQLREMMEIRRILQSGVFAQANF